MTMASVRRAIFFTAVERYASVVIVMASTAALARLLTPREFGVYAVLSALSALANAAFQEFGGANYLIQKQNLTVQEIRTAFTATFGLSCVFATLLFVSRDIVANVFNQDGMREGVSVFCLCFLLSPFSATLTSLLRREMEFAVLARGNLAANAVNAASTVLLALREFSFMAPIWGVVLGNSSLLLLIWFSRPRRGIFWPSLIGFREIMRFGGYSGAVVIINVLYQSFPPFMLGRAVGFDAAGLFARSLSITQLYDRLILQILNPILMPAISAHARSIRSIRTIYLSSIEMISGVQWPFLLFLSLMAKPIIIIWLGPTWLSTVVIVQLLCFSSLSLFAACLTYPTLVALGRVRDALISSLISLTPSFLIVAVAALHGAQAVAAVALITSPLQAFVSMALIARRLEIRTADIFRALRKSAVAAVCSMSGPILIASVPSLGFGDQPLGLASVCAAGLVAVASWLFALIALRHPLADQIRHIVTYMSSRLARQRAWAHRLLRP